MPSCFGKRLLSSPSGKHPSAEWGAGLYRIMLLMLFTLFFNWELRASDDFPALLYDDGGAARVLALFTAQEVMAR